MTEPNDRVGHRDRGNLPGEGNDQPYLVFPTHSDDPDEMAEWTDVLDRMVATLDIGE